MISKLKQARQVSKPTQQETADLLQVSVRSYKTYEKDLGKDETLKYQYMSEQLEILNYIDKEHGILELKAIIKKAAKF